MITCNARVTDCPDDFIMVNQGDTFVLGVREGLLTDAQIELLDSLLQRAAMSANDKHAAQYAITA